MLTIFFSPRNKTVFLFTLSKTFAYHNQNVLNKTCFVVLIISFLWMCLLKIKLLKASNISNLITRVLSLKTSKTGKARKNLLKFMLQVAISFFRSCFNTGNQKILLKKCVFNKFHKPPTPHTINIFLIPLGQTVFQNLGHFRADITINDTFLHRHFYYP